MLLRFWGLIFSAFALATHPLRAEIQHVIAISVDGLRGDFLQTFVAGAPAEFPNIVRLRDASGYTYNARCDYDFSETVPNHLTMVTGRPVSAPTGLPGVHHGFSSNFPTTTDTVHASGTNPGVYKAGIFDVVHDRGLSTALYLGKTRLEIVRRSYNATNGALDTIGIDNGRNKIDFAQVQDGNTSTLITALVARIAGNLERFTFLHITDPDTAGHGSGWTTTTGGAYRNSIKTLDGYLGSILNALAANPVLTGRVALLLTGDHGGGGNVGMPNAHTDATQPGNYTVPFFVLAPGVAGGSDAYSLFQNRFNPGGARLTYTEAAQPMRNGDIPNLAAALLGLPPVPGAIIVPEFKAPLNVSRAGDELTVRWPVYLTGWTLESTDDLGSPSWRPATGPTVESNGSNVHTVPLPLPDQRFFRLRRPVETNPGRPNAPAKTIRRPGKASPAKLRSS